MSFNPLQSFKASEGKKACQRRPNLATCNTKRSNMLKYDIFSVSKPRDVRLGKYPSQCLVTHIKCASEVACSD